MKSSLPRLFLTGLLTVLPVVVTIAILAWLAGFLEAMLGGLLAWILPDDTYRPGMGLVASLFLILALGVIMSTWLAQQLFNVVERWLLKVPLINTLYGAVKDVTELFSPKKQRQFNAVVAFTLPGTTAKVIGFVTRDDCSDLPASLNAPGTVAVYLPMSYQLGGYTLFLPRDQLELVDMPTADAMRFALTAGVTRRGSPEPPATSAR